MTGGRLRLGAVAAVAAIAFGAAGPACQTEPARQQSGRAATRLPQPEQALSQKLMIALGKAKDFHHKADVYLSEGQVDRAARAVRQILTIPFPKDAPEAEDVRLDARARLAKLLIGQGHLDEAMTVIDRGLAGKPRPSFFLANLYTVRGEAYEARAKAVAATDPDAARDARTRALAAYNRSIQIDTALQRKLMKEDSP